MDERIIATEDNLIYLFNEKIMFLFDVVSIMPLHPIM
jgi:hypothetical protein